MDGHRRVRTWLRRRMDAGRDRFFRDQTYHHAVMRALNQVVGGGADISEVLQAITDIRAGDEQSWCAAWSALAQRNLARADSVHNRQSRGEALLRAHTYYARAQFYLPPDDPKRSTIYPRCRKAFYDGLRHARRGLREDRRALRCVSPQRGLLPGGQPDFGPADRVPRRLRHDRRGVCTSSLLPQPIHAGTRC